MYADYFLLTIFPAFNQAFNQYISMKDPNCTIFKYIYNKYMVFFTWYTYDNRNNDY